MSASYSMGVYMSLYLDSGYINFDYVEKLADSNHINFVVIIGKRQVGKTYGTLDLMLRRGYYFMLLRRTADEMKFITVDVNNPFEKLPYNVKIESESKYTARLLQYDTLAGTEERIGSVTALSTIAKIRGFDGSRYTQLVYDEAIPETHVIKLRNEGDAFLNAYTTISGNRELEGMPPLRAWLLANSNDIHAPILHALGINEVVERMSYSAQELAVLDKRGIVVILPASEHVTELRSKTALYRAIGTESEFSKMSLTNEFSYNDRSDVCRVNLRQYKPLLRVDDLFIIWEHKSEDVIYVSTNSAAPTRDRYANDEAGRRRFRNDWPDTRALYMAGAVQFQTVGVKALFIDFIYG